jgi:hypothetical protein
MARFVLPGHWPGLLKRGNIDIDARLKVAVPVGGGRIASVLSVSWQLEPEVARQYGIRRPKGCEVLVPMVIRRGNKWVTISARGALDHFFHTGQNLGFFDDAHHATFYGNHLHVEQANKGRARNR